MKPDIYVRIRFKTAFEGGRLTDLQPSQFKHTDYYACPLFIDGKAYDCRLKIDKMTIELGKHYELPVKFLNKGLVKSHLSVGKKVVLWEGKEIGNGVIVKIC